jgi:hypothetical protein
MVALVRAIPQVEEMLVGRSERSLRLVGELLLASLD